jgi:VCBS repeat-containing protein
MPANATRLGLVTVCVVLAVSLLGPGQAPLEAQNPTGARYCAATDQVFWFVQASDTHIGTSGSTDTTNLNWLVTTGRSVIKPLFTVVTGDLTDSTNANFLGIPNGPYVEEWTAYRAILTAAGVTTSDYYDLPGNHDAYNDKYFAYYRGYALQGQNYVPGGEVAWTKDVAGIGRYHFVGVNTADNTGAAFSLSWPYGDNAGLDATELAALSSDLSANLSTSRLTFVFGHHPVTSTGSSSDTYLLYGAQDFIHTLDVDAASAYEYGHVHDNVETMFTGDSYTGPMTGAGVRYARVASLGKDSPNSFMVVSVDCDGVNSIVQPVGTWPVVLVTAPVNRYVGTALNPYAYSVPAAADNPIRALVFDAGMVSSVRFRVDGSTTWQPMGQVSGTASQWAGRWDASAVATGEHSIEVSAVGTTTRSHVIKVWVTGVNHAPTAADDSYSTPSNATLTVAAPGVLANDSDPDANPLTAQLQTGPAKGTLALNPNGGFTYTPNSGATGTDTFTYVASDGAAFSNLATVTIALTAAADKVTIKSATYTKKTSTLAVQATSTAAPAATLTVVAYGTMTYNAKTKVYSYSAKTTPAPASVTVTSSAGGSATRTVTVK